MKRMKELLQGDSDNSDKFATISTLSDRQLQIFSLIGKGLGTVDIAKKSEAAPKPVILD